MRLPTCHTPLSSVISDNPKFYPFLKDAVGGMDGTQIGASPREKDSRARYRNRKGFLSTNVLAAVNFDLMYVYVLSGWEGSASDSAIYHDARTGDLAIPNGSYFLADAGYPACNALLVPYRGVRYHLREWGAANQR